MNLESLASDLNSFLKVVDLPPKKIVQPQSPTPEAPESERTESLNPAGDPARLVRAAWDYVSSRLDECDDAQAIGEVYMLAVSALAQDAGVDRDAMQSAAIDFLESIVESARGSL